MKKWYQFYYKQKGLVSLLMTDRMTAKEADRTLKQLRHDFPALRFTMIRRKAGGRV